MVEGLFYLCSENKGADQLRGYREADLRLCFRICKKLVFSRRSSNDPAFKQNMDRHNIHTGHQILKMLLLIIVKKGYFLQPFCDFECS